MDFSREKGKAYWHQKIDQKYIIYNFNYSPIQFPLNVWVTMMSNDVPINFNIWNSCVGCMNTEFVWSQWALYTPLYLMYDDLEARDLTSMNP